MVSWVIIKDGKSEDKQQGAQLSVSSSERFHWSCSIFSMQTPHLSFVLRAGCFIFRSADISFVWCFSKKFISEVFLSHKIPSLQVTMASLSLHFTQSPFDLECVIKEWRMDRGREQRRFYWEGRGGGERCSFHGPLQRWLSSGGAIAIAVRCLFLNFHSARQPPIPMCDLLLLSEMLNN